jgi:hypothetical protein
MINSNSDSAQHTYLKFSVVSVFRVRKSFFRSAVSSAERAANVGNSESSDFARLPSPSNIYLIP